MFLFAFFWMNFFRRATCPIMARNLVKYDVTKLSRAAFSDRASEKPASRAKRNTTDARNNRSEISPRNSFSLQCNCTSIFTTLSQVIITFDENGRAHKMSILMLTWPNIKALWKFRVSFQVIPAKYFNCFIWDLFAREFYFHDYFNNHKNKLVR